VDNASNPDGQGLAICRADGLNTEILDITEPDPEPPVTTQEISQPEASELERAGARLSGDSRSALHEMRDKAMQLCNCEECQAMCSGDDEPDGDEGMQERVQAVLERAQLSILQRHNAILARYAQFDTDYAEIRQQLETFKDQLQQLNDIKTILERVASSTALDEVRASLGAVKDQVERIAKTPLPGGPIQNGARPYEKTNPYQPETPIINDRSQVERETLQRLNAMGAFQTSDDQVAAAALLLRPMQSMR